MPRQKKAPGAAVDKRNGQRIESVNAPASAPEPPAGLRPDSLEAWAAYWTDVVAGVARPCDLAIVRRWIANLNRCLTLLEEADQEPIVVGSTGQPKPNGLYDLALKLEASTRADEAQLGIGPKNGAALGLAVISERRSLDDMNARYSEETPSDAGDEDPRLRVIHGEVV